MAEKLQDRFRGFIVPVDIFDVPDLDWKEQMVYIVLRSFANPREATAFPSYATIGKLGRMSRRSAIRAVESLAEKGLLHKEIRLDVSKNRKIKNTSNLYTINNPSVTESLPLVTESHQGGVTESLPLVTESHQGGVTESPEQNNLTKQHRTKQLNNNKGNVKKEIFSEKIVVSTDKASVVVVPDSLKIFLAEKKLKVNRATVTKWLQLADEETILAAIKYTLSKGGIKTVTGYVTRILQAGFTPDMMTTSDGSTKKKSNLPEWIVKQELVQSREEVAAIEELDDKKKREAMELLLALGELGDDGDINT